MCSQEEQLETSLEVQPDGITGKNRDGEHNPLDRPQVSNNEDKVVVDGTPNADQGGDFVFQAEVGMNLETSQAAARNFELEMSRQQQGAAAKITYRGETTLCKQISGETRTQQQHNKCQLETTLLPAGNSEGQRRPSKTSSLTLGDRGKMCSFLPSGYVVFCTFCHTFLCFVSMQISLVIMPGSKDYKNPPLKMGASGTREPDG